MNNKIEEIIRDEEAVWEQRKLGELVKEEILEAPLDGNHGEKHPTSDEYVDSGIPFLMASDIHDGEVNIYSCKYITKERAERLDKGFARNGDVLLTHKATIGETAILSNLMTEYAMLTPQVTYYRIKNEERLNREYLYSFFNSLDFQTELKTKAAQSTRPYIGITAQQNLKIILPAEIDEQRKIGLYFRNLDYLITLHQRSSLYFLKINTFVWEQRKVTELLKNSSSAMKIGPFGSALKKEYFVDEGIKVYAQENAFTGDFSIGDYYITEDKYKELQSCELYPGDLVISMMGTIGACAIFPENAEKGIMNSHLLRLQFDNEVIPKYIMYLLRDSDLIRKQIDRLSVGSIMSGLSSSVVKKLVFPIPTLAEQKRIVEYLDSLNNLITLHHHKLFIINGLKLFTAMQCKCYLLLNISNKNKKTKKEIKLMPELERVIEEKLIDQLVYGDSQWTYREDLKTEEDLWRNFKYILEQNNKDRLNGESLSDAEFEQVKNRFFPLLVEFTAKLLV